MCAMEIPGVTFPIVLNFYGHAEPAGSKSSWVPKGKDGKPIVRDNGRIVVNTADSNKKSKGWKNAVKASAGVQYLGPLLRCSLTVEMIFYVVRKKGDYGTGRNAGVVKDSSPAYPAKRPDVLKLARGVEDALTGTVWLDDALIVDERIAKRFGEKEGVEVRIWATEAQRVDDLVALGQIIPLQPQERFEQLSLVAAA